jgi:inner membrane transporter RhtA
MSIRKGAAVLAVHTEGAADLPEPQGRPSALARLLHVVPPPGLLLLAILSMQFGAALAISFFGVLGPLRASALRLAFSGLILLAFIRPDIGILRRRFWLLLLFGAVLAGMNLTIYQALARLPQGVAITVEFLGPLAVAAATSRRRIDFLWIGLALFGVLLLTPVAGSTTGRLDPVGLVLALVAAAGWGAYVLISPKVGQAVPGHDGLAFGFGLAGLLVLPLALLLGGGTGAPPTAVLLGMLAVAVFSTAIPFTLEFEALRRMPPKTYGVLVTLEPAVASLAGLILLHQAIGPRALAAMLAVTVAAMGATLTKKD